jgi:hypothetical protein
VADEVARILHEKGSFAIVTASLSAANQNEWIAYIKARIAGKYPGVKLAVIRPSDGDSGPRIFRSANNSESVSGHQGDCRHRGARGSRRG